MRFLLYSATIPRFPALLAALAVAGCASVEMDSLWTMPETPTPSEAPAIPVAVLPPDGFSFEDIAALARDRSDEAAQCLLDAESRLLKTRLQTAWKAPQLRLGRSEEDDSTLRESGDWTRLGLDGLPSCESEDGSATSYSAALRIPLSNPVASRWMRRQGMAETQALCVEAQGAASAAYDKAMSLCLDAEILRRRIALDEERLALLAQRAELQEQRKREGIGETPLAELQAAAQREKRQAELFDGTLEHAQVLRNLSVLSGVPVDQLVFRDDALDGLFAKVPDEAFAEEALERHPDVQMATLELEAALAEERSIRARRIPWFDFVEGSYSWEDSDSTERSNDSLWPGRQSGESDEWQVRVGVSIPVFSWFGDEADLARQRRRHAEFRLQQVRARVKTEIRGLQEDCAKAREEYARLQETLDSFRKRLDDNLAQDPDSGDPLERLALQDEFTAFRRILLQTEGRFCHLRLLLNSKLRALPPPHDID